MNPGIATSLSVNLATAPISSEPHFLHEIGPYGLLGEAQTTKCVGHHISLVSEVLHGKLPPDRPHVRFCAPCCLSGAVHCSSSAWGIRVDGF